MKRFNGARFITLLLSLGMLSSMIFGNGAAGAMVPAPAVSGGAPAKAAPAPQLPASGTTVVTAVNMQGWAFINEGGNGYGALVTGPGLPPRGNGSVALTIGPDGKEDIDTQLFAGVPLSQITDLTYSTYGPNSTQAVSLQLDVNYDGVNHWEGRLVYEPYMNGTVLPNTWQHGTRRPRPRGGGHRAAPATPTARRQRPAPCPRFSGTGPTPRSARPRPGVSCCCAPVGPGPQAPTTRMP